MISCVSCSSRPISVDFPSSTEPQVMKRRISFDGIAPAPVAMSRASKSRASMSEVSFPFLLLHRRVLVAVDEAAISLRYPDGAHLVHNLIKGASAGLDGAGEGIAAQRPEAD